MRWEVKLQKVTGLRALVICPTHTFTQIWGLKTIFGNPTSDGAKFTTLSRHFRSSLRCTCPKMISRTKFQNVEFWSFLSSVFKHLFTKKLRWNDFLDFFVLKNLGLKLFIKKKIGIEKVLYQKFLKSDVRNESKLRKRDFRFKKIRIRKILYEKILFFFCKEKILCIRKIKNRTHAIKLTNWIKTKLSFKGI